MSLRKCLETKVDIFMVGGYKAAVQHPSVH
jgi:hypothetical protein